MEQLTPEQQNAVQELRTRLEDVLKPNMYEDILMLYRFLKARDWDINEAETMLRKHIQWRKSYKVDTILQDHEPKEFFHKFAKPSIIGKDKEESLIVYSPVGKVEIKEILQCTTMSEYTKNWIWFAETTKTHMKQPSEIKNGNALKLLIILDLDKLSFGNATNKAGADLFSKITVHLQNNYPEYMKLVFIINAPAYYIVVFTVVKAIMSNAMIQKVHVFGHSGWKGKLLEWIDADVLPAFLGGNLTDPDGDPLCKSLVNHGGKIPSEYFLTDEDRYFQDNTGVTKISVPSKKKVEVSIDVTEPESLIQWEFYSKRSIGFGLFYESSDQHLEDLLPVIKYDTSDGMERDSYKTCSVGKYIIVFDNTSSWMGSKEVEYRIEIKSRDL